MKIDMFDPNASRGISNRDAAQAIRTQDALEAFWADQCQLSFPGRFTNVLFVGVVFTPALLQTLYAACGNAELSFVACEFRDVEFLTDSTSRDDWQLWFMSCKLVHVDINGEVTQVDDPDGQLSWARHWPVFDRIQLSDCSVERIQANDITARLFTMRRSFVASSTFSGISFEAAVFEGCMMSNVLLRDLEMDLVRFINCGMVHVDTSNGGHSLQTPGRLLAQRGFYRAPDGWLWGFKIFNQWRTPPMSWKIEQNAIITEQLDPNCSYACGTGIHVGNEKYMQSMLNGGVVSRSSRSIRDIEIWIVCVPPEAQIALLSGDAPNEKNQFRTDTARLVRAVDAKTFFQAANSNRLRGKELIDALLSS